MKPICIMILFSFFLGMACVQNPESSASSEMPYPVIPDLIGERIVADSLGFSLFAPKDWNPVDRGSRTEYQLHLQDQAHPDARFFRKPLVLYVKGANQSTLTVSQVSAQKDMTLSQLASEMEKYARYDQGGKKLKRCLYRKGGVFIEHLFKEDLLRVVNTLMFINRHGNAIEIEYTTLKSEYETESGGINSSMGSLQPEAEKNSAGNR